MKTVRVADYIAKELVKAGIHDIFMVTGGGAMHLNDAIGRCEGLRYICCHHEQACAMAAESYARVTGGVGALCVTTGPGGINAINGVFGAWTDSIPMIVISGQVKRETALYKHNLIGKLRQLGDQEVDIIGMAHGITKYAVTIDDPASIRYHLERALHLARSGRPGPVWIDVPVDAQGALINPKRLPAYDPREDAASLPRLPASRQIAEIAQRLKKAVRPVLMLGTGVRLADVQADVLKVAEQLGIPLVTAWNAHDLVPDAHPLYVGRPGTVGDRAGNYAVQAADLLLVLGCRLNIRQISYNWKNFADHAFKIIVDIDTEELAKPTVCPDMAVHADLRAFVPALLKEIKRTQHPVQKSHWLAWCRRMRSRYPVCEDSYWKVTQRVNPYCFMRNLSELLPKGAITVAGNGSACVCAFQGMIIKQGQRLYSNSGCASMGYDLPAAIGAYFGTGERDIICLAGDGSLQMNVQDLATVAGYHMKIKLFVLNNGGYHSIRQTQTAFFSPPLIGCDASSGVFFPNLSGLAKAYGLPFAQIRSQASMPRILSQVLRRKGPVVCEVLLDAAQPFAPKLSARRLPDGRMESPSLEDMAPFLQRDEHEANLRSVPART